MLDSLRDKPLVWLAVGLVAGLAAGSLLPNSPAHAVATDRYENFAICTAALDGQAEALYFLDFTTGELKAAVLSETNGQFTTGYGRNIINDFGIQNVKNPRFLLIPGQFEFRGGVGVGGTQLASSAVYVCELSTGQVCVYSVPWNTQRLRAVQPLFGEILLLTKAQFRNIVQRGG